MVNTAYSGQGRILTETYASQVPQFWDLHVLRTTCQPSHFFCNRPGTVTRLCKERDITLNMSYPTGGIGCDRLETIDSFEKCPKILETTDSFKKNVLRLFCFMSCIIKGAELLLCNESVLHDLILTIRGVYSCTFTVTGVLRSAFSLCIPRYKLQTTNWATSKLSNRWKGIYGRYLCRRVFHATDSAQKTRLWKTKEATRWWKFLSLVSDAQLRLLNSEGMDADWMAHCLLA